MYAKDNLHLLEHLICNFLLFFLYLEDDDDDETMRNVLLVCLLKGPWNAIVELKWLPYPSKTLSIYKYNCNWICNCYCFSFVCKESSYMYIVYCALCIVCRVLCIVYWLVNQRTSEPANQRIGMKSSIGFNSMQWDCAMDIFDRLNKSLAQTKRSMAMAINSHRNSIIFLLRFTFAKSSLEQY